MVVGVPVSVMIVSALLLLGGAQGAHPCVQGCSEESAWEEVDKTLLEAIDASVFPGCVAVVGTEDGVLYTKAFGHHTYDPSSPAMDVDSTFFDMASLTKVVATTSATALLYQWGVLDLDTLVSDPTLLGPAFSANGKQRISVRNLLLHNAGFPPDPTPQYFWPEFGCPQTENYHPAMDFSCMARIYAAVCNQSLDYMPGTQYVYSDLSMITLMYVVGKVARVAEYVSVDDLLPGCPSTGLGSDQCYYEAFVRNYVLEKLSLSHTMFRPPPNVASDCAPAWNDTTYLHKVTQGVVSDQNAYALGGIAGHAGLFSTGADVLKFATRLLTATEDDKDFLNSTTVALFTHEANHNQSSRALGWNTNDYTVDDRGWGQSCGMLSEQTFMHLGYTGTEICVDPTLRLVTVLLTNRVYPNDDHTQEIHDTRARFNNAVKHALSLAHDGEKVIGVLEEGLRHVLRLIP